MKRTVLTWSAIVALLVMDVYVILSLWSLMHTK